MERDALRRRSFVACSLLIVLTCPSVAPAQQYLPPLPGESPAAIPPPRAPLGDFLDDLAAEDLPPEEDEDQARPPLSRDPLAESEVSARHRDPYLFPRLVNLIVEDEWELEADGEAERAEVLRRRSHATIMFPAPDTANFPNSAFTLPKGRAYIETSPVGFYGPSTQASPQYNWEFLFRYGLTDNLEFRLFSNGYTSAGAPLSTTGFSPLVFDVKINFWEENPRYFLPAFGLEAYIQTDLGSPAFNGGTQPSLNLLFDHSLPLELQLEYNFSITGVEAIRGLNDYVFGFQWALQRSLTDEFAVFTHGFYNAAALPRFPNQTPTPGDPPGPTPPTTGSEAAVVVGAGALWSPTDRLSFFGSYNAGLNRASPSTIALFGVAVAF